MHFKMYKSGKNWMVAGLMTTAVLAGLTLGNVNATEAHAAVNSAATTSTCPAPNAVADAKTASDKAAAAVSDQQGVVSQAQSDVNKAAQANEGISKLNEAIAERDAAKNAQSAAASEYYNVDLPAEKAAKSALDTAAVASQKAAASAKTAKGLIASANKQLAQYQKDVQTANNMQKKVNDTKSAYDPLNSLYQAKQNEVTKYQGLTGTPNFDQDHLNQLNDELSSLQEVTAPLAQAYHDAQLQYDKFMAGQSIADLQAKVTRAENYIKAQQKLIDDAKAAHEAWVNAQQNYKDALANSTKSFSAKNDNSAVKAAQRKIDQIRKEYGIKTNAEMKQLQTKIQGDQRGLKQAQDKANQNADYVKATQTFPKSLQEKQQQLADAQKQAADLKKQSADLQNQVDAAQAKVDDLKAKVAAATGDEKGKLAIQLGDAEHELSKLQGQLKTVNGTWSDLTKPLAENGTIAHLEDDINSIQVNQTAIENTTEFKGLQGEINKWQGWLDTDTKAYNDALAIHNAAQTLANARQNLTDAQNKLTDLQKVAADKLATYQALQKALDDCQHENTQTDADKSGDQNNNGNATKPGDQNNNGNATKPGDQNNNGNATKPGENTSATVNGNHQSKVSVKDNGKKAVAATTAKAKKLPQTGNDSAAVVALGALTGMLGLGLAAKRREF